QVRHLDQRLRRPSNGPTGRATPPWTAPFPASRLALRTTAHRYLLSSPDDARRPRHARSDRVQSAVCRGSRLLLRANSPNRSACAHCERLDRVPEPSELGDSRSTALGGRSAPHLL